MSKLQVLTIAGSDSGGGAGIQADIKTFQERDVFGTSVITAVTAQNTHGVQGVYKVPLEGVQQQLESIFDDFSIQAIKTGMLVDDTYMTLIADFLEKHPTIPLVVDPVMIAKGGANLMENNAVKVMQDRIVPIATLLTPNIPEAEELAEISIRTEADMMEAAKILQKIGSKNIVIKGGHTLNKDFARDYLLMEDGSDHWYDAPRIDTPDTHGTGCTYSACITAELAKGETMKQAVAIGKAFIHAAIANPINVGHGHGPTNHWAYGEGL